MQDSIVKIVEAAEIAGQRFYLNVSSRFSGQQGGSRFGRNTGNSLEFMDHREYQPGDDIRHIDWNAMARSDRLTVKLFREEVTPHIDIFMDASLSMALEDTSKCGGALSMAAIFRAAAVNSDYSVAQWLIKDQCRKIEPANLPIDRWPDAQFNFAGNIGKTVTTFLPRLKPNGVRVLISDLFWDQEPMTVLRQFADGAALLVIVQMLAYEDVNPALAGNVRLIDCESAEAIELMVDESLILEYQRNFFRHQQYWKKCCSKTGAVFVHCLSDKLIADFMPEELLRAEILMARS